MFYAKQYRFEGGRSDGMRGVDIDNGAGICFTVLPDRAMDIGRFSYKGINCSHITKAGYVSPQYYDDKGVGGLKIFSGGFLTTCGLTQVGSPCIDNGRELGLHGTISNIPAEYFSVLIDNGSDVPEIKIQGYMRLAKLFDCNLWLKRKICVKVGDSKVFINDEVENRGGETQPYMVLYHFNIGYPLLDGNCKIFNKC